MWKGAFVVTVMTAAVSNAGKCVLLLGISWEVKLFFCLYFYPMDDLFLCEVQYVIMQHVLMMKSGFSIQEQQNGYTKTTFIIYSCLRTLHEIKLYLEKIRYR